MVKYRKWYKGVLHDSCAINAPTPLPLSCNFTLWPPPPTLGFQTPTPLPIHVIIIQALIIIAVTLLVTSVEQRKTQVSYWNRTHDLPNTGGRSSTEPRGLMTSEVIKLSSYVTFFPHTAWIRSFFLFLTIQYAIDIARFLSFLFFHIFIYLHLTFLISTIESSFKINGTYND